MKKPPKQVIGDSIRGQRILYLKAQGLSNNEVARLEGITYPQVSLIIRQPWFQEKLAQILHVQGMDEIRKKALAYGATAMDTAFEMMHDAKSETVKANCAFQLMKVGIGETQNIKHQEVSTLDPLQLEEEIRRKEEELMNLTKPKEMPASAS